MTEKHNFIIQLTWNMKNFNHLSPFPTSKDKPSTGAHVEVLLVKYTHTQGQKFTVQTWLELMTTL